MLYACNCRMGWNARKAAMQEREGAGIIIVVIIIIDTPLDMVGSGKRREEGRKGVTGVESVGFAHQWQYWQY